MKSITQKRKEKKTPAQKRAGNAEKRINEGKEYFDYLFKITGQYSGSAKVFTGISTGLLALPFFQINQILLVSKTVDYIPLIVLFAGLCLGSSVILGAFYQSEVVKLVEDEVEFGGEDYDTYISRVQRLYGWMIGTMMGGMLFTVAYIFLILLEGDAMAS
jgi:hypothetical protein